MENIVLYPILAQFATSIILMFLWRNVKLQKVVSVAASFVILGIAIWLFWTVYNQGFQSVQSGKWEAPFGITFVADTLSATLGTPYCHCWISRVGILNSYYYFRPIAVRFFTYFPLFTTGAEWCFSHR
ncbi:membrane hypothetical protein [Capnocytophaga canimorsus]|uniref:Uncharacterized protein n=1 Tax=Capnocytophaga canimorsus TaxID=28188 RepID=A0A0B7HR17_9FLAO|nr:membrane hypothetical protein [Capnocytophaga canimorsus]